MPSDDITVFYKTTGSLARIIPDYYDFIFATIKQPLKPFTGSPPSGSDVYIIVSDNAKVISFPPYYVAFYTWNTFHSTWHGEEGIAAAKQSFISN